MKSSFAKKVLLLVTGTAAGQIIIIITMPLITRIYSPESFGIYGAITSIVGIIAVISSLRYEISIPLIRNNKFRSNIVVLSLFLLVLTSIIILFFLVLINILSNIQINKYYYFIPLAVFFTGLYQILVNISVVNDKLKEISVTRFNQSFSQVIVQLSGFFFNGAILFLFSGFLVGRISGVVKLIKSNNISIEIFKCVEKNVMKKEAIKYKDFPIYSMPSSFINSLGVNSVPILILAIYGPNIAGMFALTNRIISAPMQLIGKAFNNALFNEAPNLSIDELKPFFRKTVITLFLLTSLPVLLVYFLEPFIFTKIFGEEWEIAGKMLRIIIFMLWFQISIIPMTEILTILNAQKIRLYWDVLRLAIVLFAFIIPSMLEIDIMITLTIYTFCMIACYLTLYFICNKVLNTALRKYVTY